MKHSREMAYLRQLCCSGLGQTIVIPELLKAVQTAIPSGSNVYTPINSLGFPVGAITDVFIPELVETALEIVPKFYTSEKLKQIDSAIKKNTAVSNPKIIDSKIFSSDLYNLIWRPCDQFHMLLGLVSNHIQPVGRLFLFRPKASRPFNSADKQLFIQLLPYIAYALNENNDFDFNYVNSGQSCLLLTNTEGTLIYLSNQAKELLTLATQPNFFKLGQSSPLSVPPALLNLCRNLEIIYKGGNAKPPILIVTNTAGRFVFRAYWMDGENTNLNKLIGITIEHQEPLNLKLLRALKLAPLSPVQKEVALLVAQNVPTDKIGEQLHIKYTTVKDHVRKIFDKLDIHRREDLLPKLLAIKNIDKLYR